MILSATGHRPNKLHDAYPERKGYNLLVNYAEFVLSRYQIELMLSGMALGWDMAVAQACFNKGIPFRACVPFKGQEMQWPERTRSYYRRLIAKAAEVVYVCDPGYCSVKMQMRNEYMVDNSEKQLALWDGTSGGTGNCVKYAKGKIEIVSCWEGYVAGLRSVGIPI